MLLVNWKLLSVMTCIFVVVLVGGVVYGAKQSVLINTNGHELRLLLPSIWKQFTKSRATMVYDAQLIAELRTDVIEGPVIIFMSDPTHALCVYENDVSLDVLEFAIGSERSPDVVDPVVVRSGVGWRRLRGSELTPVIERLHGMGNEEFRQMSAPSLDVGVFQVFRAKKLIEDRLVKTARRS